MGQQDGEAGAKALASLTQLTSLDLGYNTFGEAAAKALASLTQLTSLNLSSNNLRGDARMQSDYEPDATDLAQSE